MTTTLVTMYDSTNPGAIPDAAQAVLGYVDGSQSQWPADAWKRFTGKPQIHMSTDLDHDLGDGWDAESGNATSPYDPRIRAKHERLIARGIARPWGYCSASWWPQVAAQIGDLPVRWLIADWTGHPHMLTKGQPIAGGRTAPADADGVQYASPSTGSGGHYDLSVVNINAFIAGGTGVATINDAIGIYPTPTGKGYYIVERNGGLWPFGDAAAHTDHTGAANVHGRVPVVAGFAVTPTGQGYWFVEPDGGVWPFGDAGSFGSVTTA